VPLGARRALGYWGPLGPEKINAHANIFARTNCTIAYGRQYQKYDNGEVRQPRRRSLLSLMEVFFYK